MKSYFESLSVLFNSFYRSDFFFKSNKISLIESVNSISVRTLYSNSDIPSFNSSAMDGYAICYKNTISIKNLNTKSFLVINTLTAGDYFELDNLDGDFVVEIMTGSRVPSLFDSVIKVEDVFFIKDDKKKILLKRSVKFGENIRIAGEDFKRGDIILEKGDVVLSSHMLSLSSFGIKSVDTVVKPKIYLLCTGNEIIDNDSNNEFQRKPVIYNSSGPYIINFFKLLGFDVIYLGLVSDSSNEFLDKIQSVLSTDNISFIITTGAVSKGVSDFIPDTLRALGVDILFHGVKIKPGKPILCAKYHPHVYFFSLPGNPISSVLGIRFFVYPFLRYILGLPFEKPIKAELVSDYTVVRKYDLFLKSYCYFKNAKFYVKILDSQESFKVSSMLESNSFVFFKIFDTAKKGDLLDVFFYNPICF